jgi:hypothetical protein
LCPGLVGRTARHESRTAALPGTRAADSIALAAASTVLVLAAVIATYIPARSACRTDPSIALRAE